MTEALHAEWTKLRTVGGTAWLMLATVTLTVALSAAAAAGLNAVSGGPNQDITKLSLTGIDLGQAVIAMLAVLAMGNEYSTGLIRVTLAALPHRPTVLAAKAAIISGVAFTAGAIAVVGSLIAGRLILPGKGFTATHGYALLSVAHGPTLRAAAGSALYLVLIALLSLGITTAVRDSATAVGIVLGLLYLFPIFAHVVSDPHWQRRLQQIAPMNAGLAIQNTTGLHGLPLSPWAGLGVLAAWAATALVAGGIVLHLRDA
jgi:ABC-2 type transport system permease protein